MTTFNEGPILLQSVRSVLEQTHEDLELLVVDDGSRPETLALLDTFEDPRLRVLPQANDGLSSARNRGLHHARGDYVCFLDADDVRAPWAFAEAAQRVKETGADLLIARGVYSCDRTPLAPFLDESTMLGFDAEAAAGDMNLDDVKAWAMACEPQAANKFVKRELIARAQARFPNDHFFEDILFHGLVIAHAADVTFLESRSFTYFQRQLRPQVTGSRGTIRFDIIGVVQVLFQLLQEHPVFENARVRGALAIGALRLLRWCEETAPTYHRFAYRLALAEALRGADPLWFAIGADAPDPRSERQSLLQYVKELLQ